MSDRNQNSTEDSDGKSGTFAGVPYSWRRVTWANIKKGFWNADDPRLLVPKVFGWGYDLNLAALWKKIRRR
jgi:hypothetical protein